MNNLLAIMSALEALHLPQVAQCAVDAAATESASGSLLLYSEQGAQEAQTAGLVAQIIAAAELKVTVFTTEAKLKYADHPYMYPAHSMIWVVNPDSFTSQVANVKNNMLWKSTSRLVLILQGDKMNMGDMFSILWEKARVVNVVALSTDMNFYTWFPYKKHTCNRNITAVKIGTCTIGKETQSLQLFPQKILNNLNDCPIYAVTSMVYPYVGFDPKTGAVKDGVEAKIVETFTGKYRGVMEYLHLAEDEPFYQYTSNEPLNGASRLLFNYDVDMAFGSMFQSAQHSPYSETLNQPHSNDELTWFIPQPELMPPVKNLYMAFDVEVWIVVMTASALMTATVYLTETILNRGQSPELGLLSINSLAITLNYGVPMPKTRFLRSFMIVGFFYGLHVVTAYQSSLISFLTKPVLEKPISSVKEGINEGLIPYMYEPHRPYIEQQGFPDQEDILKKDRHVFRKEMQFQYMKTFKDKMILGVKSTTLFYLTWMKKVDENKQLLVRTLQPGVLSFFVTIISSKGNPIKEKLDLTVEQLIESGLKEKWMQDLLKQNDHLRSKISSEGNSALTVENLIGAYWILLVGIALSTMVFTIEGAYFQLARKQRRNKMVHGDRALLTMLHKRIQSLIK